MKLNIQWKKVLYGIILIVIGIILAALHFIVAGDGIRDFISSIIAVISVLVMLVGTYITSSGIKNCKWKLSWRIQEWWRIRLYGRIWTMEKLIFDRFCGEIYSNKKYWKECYTITYTLLRFHNYRWIRTVIW